MKKTLIMTCIAALAISSCMKDEVKEVNHGRAIDFRVATQTKGQVIEGTYTLANFYATALDGTDTPYFNDVVFSLVGDYFSSSPEYYWPNGKDLDFYAYAPAVNSLGENAEVTITATEKKITGIKPHSDILQQVDFVSAKVEDRNAENSSSGIPITFYHNLTGVAITADNEIDDYEYIINGVKINNAISSGDFDLENDVWTKGADKVDYEFTCLEPISLVKKDESGYNNSSVYLFGKYIDRANNEGEHFALIIPQAFNTVEGETITPVVTLSLNLQINHINADGSKTRVFPESGADYDWVETEFPNYTKNSETCNEWFAGERYVYNISFNDPSQQLGEPVKMTTSFKPWVDGNSNTFANKEMIGKWTATDFYEIVTESYTEGGKTWINEENGYYDIDILEVTGKDGNPYEVIQYKQNHLDSSDKIAADSDRLGGFNYVEIEDGTKMYILVNGIKGETPYVLENDYLLIAAFEDHTGEYYVTPHIDEIVPVGDDGTEGSGIISALQNNEGSYEAGNYYRRVQMITYKIESINK